LSKSHMSSGRKHRTPTTRDELSVLSARINRFFSAPDRSPARAEIVAEAISLLNHCGRQWTSRTVRLWFNNNQQHYLRASERSPLVRRCVPVPQISSLSPPLPTRFGLVVPPGPSGIEDDGATPEPTEHQPRYVVSLYPVMRLGPPQ
jgi:hypothetical protein